MAHNLNKEKGVVSFASTKPAWHGLGQIVDKAMTAKEAIELARLDYEVEKHHSRVILPQYVEGENNGTHYIHDDGILTSKTTFHTVRMDTNQILGTVGSLYTIVQNTEAFEFFTDFAGEKAAMF